jgi:drug/metabolite transporter (DMT)-like permease
MRNHSWFALFAVIVSAIFFAVCNSLVKSINTQISVSITSLVQCLVCFIYAIPWVYRQSFSAFKTNYMGLYVICAFSEVISIYPFYWSLHYIPLVDGILLNNTGPLWIPLFVLFIYQVKIAKQIWMGFIIGIIGIIFIIKPDSEIFQSASLLALLSGLGTGVVTFIIGILSKMESSKQILCHCFLLSACMLIPIACLQWQMPSLLDLTLMVLSGISLLLGTLSLSYGFKHGNVVILSPLLYLNVVFSGIIDWYFWHMTPSYEIYLGTFFVISGITITILFQSHYLDSPPVLYTRINR